MPLSAAIDRAVEVAFPADRDHVRAGIARVADDSDWVRGATLALTFGDRALFDVWVVVAGVEARDIAYAVESPQVVRPDLTRAEIVRRFRLMGLPVPDVLAGEG